MLIRHTFCANRTTSVTQVFDEVQAGSPSGGGGGNATSQGKGNDSSSDEESEPSKPQHRRRGSVGAGKKGQTDGQKQNQNQNQNQSQNQRQLRLVVPRTVQIVNGEYGRQVFNDVVSVIQPQMPAGSGAERRTFVCQILDMQVITDNVTSAVGQHTDPAFDRFHIGLTDVRPAFASAASFAVGMEWNGMGLEMHAA